MSHVTVDFVSHSRDRTGWSLVLVEQGPWPEHEVAPRLRALQDRLYGCIDALIEGEVAKQFPTSLGQGVEISVDGYCLPEEDVRSFFQSFSEGVLKIPDYAAALARQSYVRTISFSLSISELELSTERQSGALSRNVCLSGRLRL